MPKNWDLYKSEIENLYMHQGHPLLDVQKAMKRNYGFEASTRAYRMKLDQWKMWKNKSKPRIRRNSEQSSTGSEPNDHSNGTRPLTLGQALSPQTLQKTSTKPFLSQVIDPRRPPDRTPDIVDKVASPELANHFPLPQVQQTTPPHHIWPLATTFSIGPLVNSSLMFFSDRPVEDSLKLLASSPLMAPLALEILLRNWKPGLQCMEYAFMFLEDRIYCGSILSVNWTQWWHMNDETLFDLVNENVPEAERNLLFTALLKADLKFTDPAFPFQVPKLCASWAVDWRLAAGRKTWFEARYSLLQCGLLWTARRLQDCALVVIAEQILERHKYQMELWKSNQESQLGASEPFPKDAMTEYFEILHDCTESNLEIDSSWYTLADVRTIVQTAREATSRLGSNG